MSESAKSSMWEIDGVSIRPLRVISDDRGAVMHMLRADSAGFDVFGEVYFSEVRPGAVKAWKRHQRMTQRFAVPAGRLLLVIHDDRTDSSTRGATQAIEIGRPDAYMLVCIPPLLWYGFTAIGDVPALIANCTNLPHDPTESESVDPASSPIPYSWSHLD